ncbi:NUDIX hydrolase [Rhodalgimonas zhirmunskyi]|uniref:NUDIX hydrolase n=1 Tax=Rhodalgimonas zhirmunskyi TaxID=2964767 RepID=A0AAJ1X8J7_9RHOB|nr:NUDIX hydrolase [Rhodoalgimonas zhirmunskyi]MDQ2095707.1 NUDIX hydrolase [Rhodoalgimonas zhirmunskyi]
MTNAMKKAWADYVQPLLQRPKRLQVAALCFRKEATGAKKVLLVTSRDTGRWIIPKGWPMDGRDAASAAMQEAWEEAGVRRGESGPVLGSYTYDKELKSGLPVAVETLVFPVEVDRLEDDFPEATERTRRWVSPEKAATMVREPQLQDILRRF